MRGTHIYNQFLQILHINIPKISGMSRPSFFFFEKKICKNKKYLPTMSAKESALIPLVNKKIPKYKISQYIQRYLNTITTQDI
jgi:hypothetical protein